MRTRRKEIVIEVVLFNVSAPFNPVLPLIWKEKESGVKERWEKRRGRSRNLEKSNVSQNGVLISET